MLRELIGHGRKSGLRDDAIVGSLIVWPSL